MINQNNWKLLVNNSNKSQKSSSDKIRNTSKKYEPKKQVHNQQKSFLTPKMSNSFLKLNQSSSLILQKKGKQLSRNDSHSKLLKQQKKDGFIDRHIEQYIEDTINKQLSMHTRSIDLKNASGTVSGIVSSKNQNALNELEKLKKQFQRFKQQVFRQLQRQQKIISKLILQTVNNYMKNHYQQKVLQMENQFQNTFNKSNLINVKKQKVSSQTMSHFKVSAMQTTESEIRKQKYNKKQIQNLEEETNKKVKYKRFFDAMNKLKNDIKDLQTISDTSVISSPKNQTQRVRTRYSQIKLP